MMLMLNKKGQASAPSNSSGTPSGNTPSNSDGGSAKKAPLFSPPDKNKPKADKPAKNKVKRITFGRNVCPICKKNFKTPAQLYAHMSAPKPLGEGMDANTVNMLNSLDMNKKQARKLFNGNNIVRNTKKYSLILLPFLVLVIVLGVYFIFFAQSNVGISYSELTYGSVFSKITGLISSGISSISTFIAEVQNPNLLVTQPQVTAVNSTPTFSSFLTFSYPSNQEVVLTTNPQQGTILYSVSNNGNVPLGPGTSNNLEVNISCGNTFSPGAAKFCNDMLDSFTSPTETQSSPPKVVDSSLVNILVPGETKENTTTFDLSCPSPSDKLTFPLSMSLLATFLVKNYTAAVILPIEFMSDAFQSQLVSSAQAFVPAEPSYNFYSSGPVQMEIYTVIKQPIITKIDSIPLEVTLTNHGQYTANINNVSIYINKDFFPSNPSTSYWSCVTATSVERQGFQFPGSGYWDCYINNQKILDSGSTFYLDLSPVNSLDGLHFNTMTVLGYVNYNYNESLNMPVVVANQTCT